VSPAYAGANGVNYETFTFTFPAISGDAIRIDGAPGGSSHFISVGELRAYATTASGGNVAPVANAGSNQTVASGVMVTLDGSASSDPNGDPITYAWTQTAGPTVTLSSATAQKPTFVAPTVSASTALTFSLVVRDASLASSPATVTVTVSASTGVTDITASGTAIALVTAPKGGGNKSLGVIKDGVFPPVGSTDSSQQYDTYTGTSRTEDWIGYQFTAAQPFTQVVFQEGKQFADGGWFTNIKIQVRQSGTWVNVSGVTVTPAYAGANGVNYETFTFNFPATTGDAIRIDGAPGGGATFISVGELRVSRTP
jgi:hypothetical protein